MLTSEQRDIVRRCVVDTLDSAIHDFVFAVVENADFEEDIQIIVDGVNVAKESDGLHGEAYGEEGWEAKYSIYGVHPEEA